MNIKLSSEIEALIKKKIAGGKYKSAHTFCEYAIRQALLKDLNSVNTSDSPPSYDDVADLLVDQKTLKYYSRDADDTVTLEDARQILSKISGSLADDIIAERG